MKLTKEQAHLIAFCYRSNNFSLLVEPGTLLVAEKQIDLTATY